MARALYIHWPFCLSKCPYCDFNSHVRAQIDIACWQEALLADMRFEARRARGQSLQSIFFGGGTPSLMPPALVAELLAEAERLWGFAQDIEITLEANPSSVEAAGFAQAAAAGVNRVSLGVQSLEDRTLAFLGRQHSAREALGALETAQRHFARTSFDVIYALPGQSEAQWRAELQYALGLGADHLSLYQLTIEPGTRFASDVRTGKLAPLDDDRAAELYRITQEQTSSAGLPAYEISNHARKGQESRHNLTYWRYQDYCGIGPGAHGRRSGRATQRHRKPENYLKACTMQGHAIAHSETLSAKAQFAESLLMGLRLREGVDLDRLAQRFGIDATRAIDRSKLTYLHSKGFVWSEDTVIGVSAKGMPLLDAILSELIAEELALA